MRDLLVWSVIHEATDYALAYMLFLRIVKHRQKRGRTVMDLNQLITKRRNTTRYTPRLNELRENIKRLLISPYTEAVYVELSEATCTSSCRAHEDLYEMIAVQYDPYVPELPSTFGFAHTYYQTTLIWYLTYFAVGNWQRLPVREACTKRHNCLLEIFTLSEVLSQRSRW